MKMKTNDNHSVRYLSKMEQVVFDKAFAQKNHKLKLYDVYRKIKKNRHLRYDITEMPAQMIGKEFVRTKGNRNSDGFQELYTVLQGKAIFFIQRTKQDSPDIVIDAKAIKAKKGDWIIVPPNYSIITINPCSRQTLKTGNWVSEKTKNIYSDIEQMNGGCYFYTQDGWIKNQNYKKVPPLRFEKSLKKEPKSLNFLRNKNV